MNNQDYRFVPFVQYRDSFAGLCTDDMALEMWIALVLVYIEDPNEVKRLRKEAERMVVKNGTKKH